MKERFIERMPKRSLADEVSSANGILVSNLIFACVYGSITFLIELVSFSQLGFGAVPKYLGLDVAMIGLLAMIVFIVPGYIAKIVLVGIFLCLQSLLLIANVTLTTMGQQIFNLSLLNLLGEAGDVFSPNMLNAGLIAGLCFLFLFVIAALIVARRFSSKVCFGRHIVIFLAGVFVMLSCASANLFSATVLSISGRGYVSDDPVAMFASDYYLWETQYNPSAAYQKFGSFGFYYRNIANALFPDRDSDREAAPDEVLRTQWSSEYGPSVYDDRIMTGSFRGQNVVLVVIESGDWFGINREYTPTLYALATQGIAMTEFYSRNKTDKSEALSILGNYPVRNSTEIYNAGLYGHNLAFTSANFLGSQGYSTAYQHPGAAGFYSRSSTHTALYGFDRLRFADQSDRLEMYYGQSEWWDFQRDSEMISQYLSEFSYIDAGDDAFFTMYMSMITHGHYTDLVDNGDYTSDLSDEQKAALSQSYTHQGLEDYYELITDYPSDYVNDKFAIRISRAEDERAFLYYKRFQAGMMDLDVGINRLIYDLQRQGELDNTLFVFYADHDTLARDLGYSISCYSNEAVGDHKKSNIPFFLWSGSCMDLTVRNLYEGCTYRNTEDHAWQKSVYDGAYYYAIDHRTEDPIGGVQVTKSCSAFDVLPTILDLLGYEYRQGLYYGISVFKEPTDVFFSMQTGCAYMKDYYYDGVRLYVCAEPTADGAVSVDGQIAMSGDTMRIMCGGETVSYSSADVSGGITFDRVSRYFSIDVEKAAGYLNDGAIEFFRKLSAYYEKQEIIEDIYEYDFFAYTDISLCLRAVL